MDAIGNAESPRQLAQSRFLRSRSRQHDPAIWQVGECTQDAILRFLEENYLPDLQANIVVEHRIDPLHFQNTLNSYLGSAFSVQPILTQSAWFRPHNRDPKIPGLYIVGAGTHPGAGLPGVVNSAKATVGLMLEDAALEEAV